jgi:6-phosphogluconolactonase
MPGSPTPVLTRRRFLGAAAALAATPAVLRRALASPPEAGPASALRPILAYVGTYSAPGNGRGIHVYRFDPATGALTPHQVLEHAGSPSSLALSPDRTHLYSANEGTPDGDKAGSVSAFAIDPADGRLRLLNTVSSGGAGPAHLSVHPAGGHVLVANYAGGCVAVLPIRKNGEVAPPSDVQHDSGPLGPFRATSAAPGSFAISGHDAPHAHMIAADPSGRFVLSTDLGLDRIYVWRFDAAAGRLLPNDPPFATVPPGDGPRHFAFHPHRRWLFCLQEEGSTLIRFDYDGEAGRLTARQSLSTLPAGFAGTSFASEIEVSADGRFVYVANRLHDTVAVFSIGPDGALAPRGEEWTRGDYPRHFATDPSGRFLLVCNQRGDSLTTFRRDPGTGALAFTGQYTPVGSPSIIVFRT